MTSLAAIADRFWQGYLEIDPLVAPEGAHEHEGRLPDMSAEGRDQARRTYSDALASLRDLDVAALTEEDRLTAELVEFAARSLLEHLEAGLDRLRAAAHIYGAIQIFPSVCSRQRVHDASSLERYVERLHGFAAYYAGWRELLDEGVEAGQTSPRLVVDRTIAQLERLLALDPAASPGMSPVADAGPAAQEAVLDALRETVWPAHAEYLEALRAYRAHATETLGLHSLPGGERLYRAAMLEHTSLGLDAGDVHAEGEARLAAAREAQRRTARELGFDSAAEALASLRATPRWTASTPDELVELCSRFVRRGWDAASTVVGRMPEAECIVKPVEPYREPDAGSAFYIEPAADGSRPGTFYVNTSNLHGRPLYQYAVTAFHEANPGHHLQIALEREHGDRHPVRQYGGVLAGSAAAEGWALYAEQLADELGLYEDPYQRLGMLESRAVRACRLVVDSGLHAFGWSRERAIDAMLEVGMTPTWSESDIDRYIAMPGQALAYTIGFSRVERWRADAERRPGFSLPAFHDRLLSLGLLPLDALEEALGH